jgi:hypothetical protein
VQKETERGGKAAGIDKIMPEMIKWGGEVMDEILVVLFGVFWKLEMQPLDWKKARTGT